MSTTPTYHFGPEVHSDHTLFRLWAPSAAAAELIIEGRDPIPMRREDDGFHRVKADAPAGTRYQFRIGNLTFPDLASRQQAEDSHGWSIVRNPLTPSDRKGPLRPWHETVIAEVHIGTATPEGTFRAFTGKLEHFRDAGFTCLEIMPINEFPGARNWGYDGTLIFAPEASYGPPEDFRALVDRAHELGLCIILDVVYNHFGSVDNFVADYAPEWFDQEVKTPWGPGIDFTRETVRRFYYDNACMWLTEYDVDGLRFDAIHEIKTDERDRFLGELAEAARGVKPEAKLILENMDNSFKWLERDKTNTPMTYWAQWNEDMHHVLAYLVTGEGKKTGYDDPQKDPIADLAKALADGFVHDQTEATEESDGNTHGGQAANLPPDSFITYVENHDQIGNRADGKRLASRIDPQQLDFTHFVKLVAPQVPLCFMGDEANIKSGFPFFVDLDEEEGRKADVKRYREMRDMFNEPVEDGGLPHPNDPATFMSAKFPWDDLSKEEHRDSLERFRALVAWRRDNLWPLAATPCLDASTVRQGKALIVNWMFEAGIATLACNPSDHAVDIACIIQGAPVSSGDYDQMGEVLRLGPWSAVAWRN